MTIEGKTFARGVREGLHDARLHLRFLPLVGRWFVIEEDKQISEKDGDD